MTRKLQFCSKKVVDFVSRVRDKEDIKRQSSLLFASSSTYLGRKKEYYGLIKQLSKMSKEAEKLVSECNPKENLAAKLKDFKQDNPSFAENTEFCALVTKILKARSSLMDSLYKRLTYKKNMHRIIQFCLKTAGLETLSTLPQISTQLSGKWVNWSKHCNTTESSAKNWKVK